MKARVAIPLALVLIVLIAAGAYAWFIHVADRRVGLETSRAEQIARDLGTFFTDTFHARPTVVVNERVFLEQSAAAQELATIQRDTRVQRETTHAWLGSTKRIRIHGLYTVKAGFDLSDRFTIRVTGDRIHLALPPARILSVEQKDIIVEALENGLWNKITPQDLETELTALPALAREKALVAGIQEEARRTLLEKLHERFGQTYKIEIEPVEAAD